MHVDGGKKAKKWRNFEDEEKRASISANVYLKEAAAAAMWRNSRRHTAIILGGGRCRQHEYIIWWFKRKKSSSSLYCFPPFSWMVILLRYIYVEVPTMCLLVWDERISGSLCVINSITRGILRVMVPNSFRDFYTLKSLKTFYFFPILYWLLRNVLHIYLPQVLGRMRYYYVETKLQAKVAFTNYMNREFWKIVHIIGV